MGHVPHLFIPAPWTSQTLHIPSSTDHHLRRVLRMTDGQSVTYTDGQGRIGDGRLIASAIERGPETSLPLPQLELTLAVAPPHDKDRMRFLVEKLTELEVRRLRWLRTRFGTRRLPEMSKCKAWAQSALEQSRGAWLMEIEQGWIEPADLDADTLFADVGAGPIAFPIQRATTVAIGPEGGWDIGEFPQGARRFGMGRTVLRVETAAVVAAARLLAHND